MANSNEKLIIKLRGVANNLPKIVDQAGSMLVRNIRSNARSMFGNDPKYPYELRNSFQRDNVVYYNPGEKAVFIDHPASKRLEYGMGEIVIKPKNGEFLKFEGRDGEDVYAREVTIAPSKPVGYVKAALKETQKDLSRKFKEVING